MGAWLALHTSVQMGSTEITMSISPSDLGKIEGIIIFSDICCQFKAFGKVGHRCGEKAAGFIKCVVVNLPLAAVGHFNVTM